jgi:hypothetical protein
MAFAYKKRIEVSPSAGPLPEYSIIDITDADFCAYVHAHGELAVYGDDEATALPFKVLGVTAQRCSVAVFLQSSDSATRNVWVYAGDASFSSPPMESWNAPVVAPASTLGPTVVASDGLGHTISESDSWVHPNVYKVPADSWMRFLDAAEVAAGAGSVTHIRIDTPYSGGIQYENPYLLYSADNGATWAPWPAEELNPLDAFPGVVGPPASGNFNSDPCALFLPSGTLRAFHREWNNGSPKLFYNDVTGTNLSDAVAAAQVEATVESPAIFAAPSMVWYRGVAYMFASEQSGYSPNMGTMVNRWQSTDNGATWSTKTVALAGGGDAFTGQWHGSVSGPINGWYYRIGSETAYNTEPWNNGVGADLRLHRSRDLVSWEAAKELAITRGSAAWCALTLYQACITEHSDGTTWVYFSGSPVGNAPYKVSRVQLSGIRAVRTVSEAVWLGCGYTTTADDAITTWGLWDFAEADDLNDCSGNGRNLTLVGTPAYSVNDGWTFSADGQRLTCAGSTLEGLSVLDVEAEVSLQAAASRAGGYFWICGYRGSNQPFSLQVNGDTGRIYTSLQFAVGDASIVAASTDIRGLKRCVIRVIYDGPRSTYSLFVNGARIARKLTSDDAEIKPDSVIRAGGTSPLWLIGASQATNSFFAGTIHRVTVRTTVPRQWAPSAGNPVDVAPSPTVPVVRHARGLLPATFNPRIMPTPAEVRIGRVYDGGGRTGTRSTPQQHIRV